MTKRCELCDQAARLFCESDQASLCWDCDARVHGANFLVARHSRNLLCRRCQVATPWKAAGERLGPTFSVCDSCSERSSEKVMEREGYDEEDDVIEEEEGEEDSDEGDAEDDGNGDEDEDGDNQVVPWTMTMTPPASSSTSEESSSRICKRMRKNADPTSSQDNRTCSSSQPSYLEATSMGGVFHSSKDRRRSGDHEQPSTAAVHIRNRRNHWSVDFMSSRSRSPPI